MVKAARIAAIRRVSPSRAGSLIACGLSEAFRAAQTVPRLPTHPKAHFGILAHGFLASVGNGSIEPVAFSMRAAWKQFVEDYELKLASDPDEKSVSPLNRTCEDFEVNALLVIKAAAGCAPMGGKPSTGGGRRIEADLSSKDGELVGRLDRVGWKHGRRVVTDFKTGSSTDDSGKVRADLVLQLKLYAFLIHENENVWPSIEIQQLNGPPLEVAYEPAEIQALVRHLIDKRSAVNATVEEVLLGKTPESTLASPSPSACRFCVYRPTCDAYWSARATWDSAVSPPDIHGRLTSITSQAGGFSVLEIAAPDGPNTVRAFRQSMIRGGNELRIAVNIRVCELWKERAPRMFSCRPISVATQF